ncbi:hypothetical protein PGH26_09265 [Sporosarcina jeotgali]|uniref:Transposase n=1 Tax=Sporosarcina jeotgali TaxID=3020056 RepID=A0ABZ0KW79_9BACL|nr:hypothetical protein [Sporosarcina sp. B2O-1]WOV83119.1 hypothetical protein PGH26_09265 [Sporosarcina sp. B2O-1]
METMNLRTQQNEMKPTIQMVKDDIYIELSTNSEIRKLCTDCMDGARILYNRYMNDAH